MPQTLIASGYQDNWWQILNSPFMHNALIGGTFVALAAGLIGYFIVVRSTAFAAHALAHIGFPGATAAVLLGLPPVLGLGLFRLGLVLCAIFNLPPSFVIVTLACGLWLLIRLLARPGIRYLPGPVTSVPPR